MFAKNLALLLHERLGEFEKFEETLKRFESLRSYGLLPRGRENAGVRLSDEQISSAILAYLPNLPGWAGHVSLAVGDLRPVGGKSASFQAAENLNKALASLLANEDACKSVVHFTLCIARKSTGDEYYARLLFETGEIRQTVSFIDKMAISLMADGAERAYDPERLPSPSARQLVLGREFFRELRSFSCLKESEGDSRSTGIVIQTGNWAGGQSA